MRGKVAWRGQAWTAGLALLASGCSSVPPAVGAGPDRYGPTCRAEQARVQERASAARGCEGDADCRAVDVRGLPGCCWLATSAETAAGPALRAAAEAANRACPRVDRRCPPHCTVRCVEGACRAPPHCNTDPACS